MVNNGEQQHHDHEKDQAGNCRGTEETSISSPVSDGKKVQPEKVEHSHFDWRSGVEFEAFKVSFALLCSACPAKTMTA